MDSGCPADRVQGTVQTFEPLRVPDGVGLSKIAWPKADMKAFKRFYSSMLDQGIYLAPSSYEAGFVSLAHTRRDVARTVEAAREALQRVAAAR